MRPQLNGSTLGGRMSTVVDLNFVSVSEADGALVVGFADHEFETTRYVMFQRSLDPDDDDGVYAERDGQQYSGYGRVESYTLSRDQINFVVSQPLANALDIPPAFSIRFDCGDDVHDSLRVGLRRLFAGTDCSLVG
jgi:hypothetical protein